MRWALLTAVVASCAVDVRVEPEGYACDPGDVCPEGFACRERRCERVRPLVCGEVLCNDVPPATCVSSTTAVHYSSRCGAGATCRYEPIERNCPLGCEGGVCRDACTGIACVTPPASRCEDGQTLRTSSQAGRCEAGGCSYATTTVVCRTACVAGACVGDDLCRGVSCASPPAGLCRGGQVDDFEPTGTCEPGTGQCRYAPRTVTCESGRCTQGRCVVDRCMGVVCSTPPAPRCVDSATLEVSDATGVCDAANGMCRYTPRSMTCAGGCDRGRCVEDQCAQVTCNTPPSAVCVGDVLRSSMAGGTCNSSTGQCSYPTVDMPCANGCSLGRCIAPLLSFAQIGPGLSFVPTAVDVAPVSGDVLVGGPEGQLMWWRAGLWRAIVGPTSRVAGLFWQSDVRAFAVTTSGQLWQVQNSTASLVPGNPTPAGTALVSIHGRSGEVVAVTEAGFWARYDGAGWSSGTFPPANAPYRLRSVYLDELGRSHVAGSCAGRSCVVTRLSGNWLVDLTADSTDTLGFSAAGPSLAVASAQSEALVGRADRSLVRHLANGNYDPTQVPVLPAGGGGVVAIAPGVRGATSREVWVLTGRGVGQPATLFRLNGALGTAMPVLIASANAEPVLSRQGPAVVLAEAVDAGSGRVRPTVRSVNGSTTAWLDVGENLTTVTELGGDTVFGTSLGDAVVSSADGGGATVVVGPNVRLLDSDGRNGTGVLFVGRTPSGNAAITRLSQGRMTAVALAAPGAELRGVCRQSDSEAWAVGTAGLVVRIDTAQGTATPVTPPTTANLRHVTCGGPGVAYACGDNGTVLMLRGGQWGPMQPALASAAALSACELVQGALYVAGPTVFARLDPAANQWTSLPPQPGLVALVARSTNDIYGLLTNMNGSSIARFDGRNWGVVLQNAPLLEGSGQVGTKMVFAGPDGVIVEGR